LVNVTASVIDEFGASLRGLEAQDFQVFENGREQTIAFFSHDDQVPVSVGVLLDISGSHGDKFRQALRIVDAVAASLSPADEMFILTFNSRVNLRQPFTSDAQMLRRALDSIKPNGETAVYDAIAAGLEEMQRAKSEKRIMLLITDGFDTRSKITAVQAEDLVGRSGVLLYAIGMDDGDAPLPKRRPRYRIYDYMLTKMTKAGNGRLIRLYTSRSYDVETLARGFLDELHQEYALGYYPSSEMVSTDSRNIDVQVAKPGARVLGERLRLVLRESGR
jgi:Ca-activated chloride channel family protein